MNQKSTAGLKAAATRKQQESKMSAGQLAQLSLKRQEAGRKAAATRMANKGILSISAHGMNKSKKKIVAAINSLLEVLAKS